MSLLDKLLRSQQTNETLVKYKFNENFFNPTINVLSLSQVYAISKTPTQNPCGVSRSNRKLTCIL